MVNREGILRFAPLYFVLSGMRFKLRESLPSWIGPIQERLYGTFPHLSRVRQSLTADGLELVIDPPDFDPAHPGAAFLFSNKDRTTSIQIHKAGLVVFTKSYLHFDQFLESLSSAVDAILASAGFLEIETIGVRYLDFIRPKDGERLDQYVDAGLLPFRPNWESWDGQIVTGSSMNSYKIEDDTLTIRFVGQGHPVVPDDMAPAYLSNMDPLGVSGNPIPLIGSQEGTLDIDAVRHGFLLQAGDVRQVEEEVRRLHARANSYFRRVCTEHAFVRWNEESI